MEAPRETPAPQGDDVKAYYEAVRAGLVSDPDAMARPHRSGEWAS